MDKLTALKLRLIERAAERHNAAPRPCDGKAIDECFTVIRGSLYFWYNDRANNTYIEKERIV